MNEKFKAILAEVNRDILDNPDCDLVEDGIIDSLCIMSLIAKCEDSFDIDFDPADIIPDNFNSAEKIWGLIEKYQKEKAE